MTNLFRIFIFLLLLSNIIFAQIVIDKKQNELNNFAIDYYHDEDKNLTFNEILKQNFKEKINNKFTFSYLKGNSWLKFEITNKTNKDKLFLHMVEPYFEVLDFYEKKENIWTKKPSGRFVELSSRDMYDISPVWVLNIKSNATKTFYVRIYSKFSQFGEFTIYTKKASIVKYRLLINSLYIFFFGSLFIMIIFNTFLFVTLKDKMYFYYVGYLISFSAFILGFSGLHVYLGLSSLYTMITIASIPSLIVFLILFSISFLDIKKKLTNIYKILKLLIVLNLFVMVMSYIDFDLWYPKLTILGSITYMVLLYMAIRSWIIGHNQAKYYLIAMSIYISSVLLMSFMINGILENNHFTRYAFLYGSFIEITVFSLLLAHRFYDIQNEKITIQKELIEMKNENENFLEKEIDSRTKKIESLLKDKEILLKEVYHRVKNNFQLIVSMLVLEKNRYETDKEKENFSLLINRIKSMSTVHQSLYDLDTISKINSYEYISKISEDVKRIYITKDIQIIENIELLDIQVEYAIPLGIIINEVLTNAIKHNLEMDKKLIITIGFKSIGGKIELIIKDNGKGFEYDKSKHKQKLGINLIEQFSKKLPNSSFEYKNNFGCIFRLIF